MPLLKACPVLLLGLLLLGCVTEGETTEPQSEFLPASALMREQIANQIESLPYLKGRELLDAQCWLLSRGETAYDQLIEALDSEEHITRSISVNVLAQRRDPRVIPYIRKLLDDPSDIVRYEVAQSLVRFGDWSQAPCLVQGMRDERFFVRALCAKCLREHFHRQFGFDPKAEPAERETAVKSWESFVEKMRQEKPAN